MNQLIISLVMLGLPYMLGTAHAAVPSGVCCLHVIGATAAEVPVVVLAAELSEKRTGSWLGVSIGEVPEALAAQLEIEGHGVIILNVVKDSPADRAGLGVHDVILSVTGEEVDGDVVRLTRLIGARTPGDRVDLVVMQGGKQKTIVVELGSRPDTKVIEWKFDIDPVEVIEERLHTRARIIGRGPGGRVFIKNLGDLDDLKDLPEQLRMMIPHLGNHSVRVFVDGERKRVKTQVERDGTTLTVEQVDDGEITVTRTDEDGQLTTTTYESENELRDADEEAFEMLTQTGNNMFMDLDFDGPHIKLHIDVDGMKEGLADWRHEFHERLAEAHDAMESAREEVEEAVRDAMEQFRDGRSEPGSGLSWARNLPKWLGHESGPLGLLHVGKPRQSFEVLSDGTIKVRLRKGGSELIRTFDSEADLQRRDPTLFEKFEELMSVSEEE